MNDARMIIRFPMAVFFVTLSLGVSAYAQREQTLLRLTLVVVSQEHCQYLPDTQGVSLHTKLTFLNKGRTDIVIQQIDGLGVTILANSVDDLHRRHYVLYSQPEHLAPERRNDKGPVTLSPGGVLEAAEIVSISVKPRMSSSHSDLVVNPGHYFLQVGENLITGSVNPNTLHTVSVLSVPVEVEINYSNATESACTK
jgi:hypothetical protein